MNVECSQFIFGTTAFSDSFSIVKIYFDDVCVFVHMNSDIHGGKRHLILLDLEG